MKNKEDTKVKDIAVLMMAGKGERLFSSLHVKKQFFKLDGKELFLYSLESLALSQCFKNIVLVVSPEDHEKVLEIVKKDNLIPWRKVMIVDGGESRNETVFKAFKSLKKQKGNFFVLIHDAARPFLTVELIENIMSKTYRADALTYCLPLADSLFRDDRRGISYLDRKDLYQVQTPQVFDYRKLLSLYEQGYDPKGTDDFSKAVQAGLKCLPVPGDLSLFKVTGKEDLVLLRKLSVFVD